MSERGGHRAGRLGVGDGIDLMSGFGEEGSRVEALSLDVIQCRTSTLKRTSLDVRVGTLTSMLECLLSTLQHMRHIHPGSPCSTITTVRLL
jgi:hypothetical protein